MAMNPDQQKKTPNQQLHFSMCFGWDKARPEQSEGDSTEHVKTQEC